MFLAATDPVLSLKIASSATNIILLHGLKIDSEGLY